jgi:hypothetical protein
MGGGEILRFQWAERANSHPEVQTSGVGAGRCRTQYYASRSNASTSAPCTSRAPSNSVQ